MLLLLRDYTLWVDVEIVKQQKMLVEISVVIPGVTKVSIF